METSIKRGLRATLIVAWLIAWGLGFAWWWSGRAERHLTLASQVLEEGDEEGALALLSVPESATSTRDRALLIRARIAVEKGDLNRAVAALDKVDPHGPAAADFAYWKGRTLFAAKQPLLATRWLSEAVRHRPDDAVAARWLAAATYDLGDRTTAVAALETVARLDPRDARVWRTLGVIHKENVEYERAAEALGNSLRYDKAQPAVRLELAEVFLKLGDAGAAKVQLTACAGLVSKSRHSALLAEALRIEGDLEGARKAIGEGLAAVADDPDLLTQQARLDRADGLTQPALEKLDRALAGDPFRIETLYQRGLLLRQLGRDQDARRDLDRAEALTRGLAEMSALNERAARETNDAEIRYRLGRLSEELGKRELAASWYRAALACDPRHEQARVALDALGPIRRPESFSPRP